MRQMLEYILGSGGAKFQVTIYYPDDWNKMIQDRKSREGILILTDEFIELQEKWFYNQGKALFKIEYTSHDEPSINITSNDTQMLTIEYTDPDDMGGGLSFTHDLRTTSR